MRTLSKDIMMICKGWYSKTKYRSTRDALAAYIENYTWCEPDDTTILHFLTHAVNVLINKQILLITLTENVKFSQRDFVSPIQFLIKTYITVLHLRIATDLSLTDYDKIKADVENTRNVGKPWWQKFTDKVLDDRYGNYHKS